MLLFIYMIYVVLSLSKMKNEGKRVSIFTKVIVYGLLILSLFMFYFRFLAFLFSPLPFFGFVAALAIGGMMLSLKIVIALALLLLSHTRQIEHIANQYSNLKVFANLLLIHHYLHIP